MGPLGPLLEPVEGLGPLLGLLGVMLGPLGPFELLRVMLGPVEPLGALPCRLNTRQYKGKKNPLRDTPSDAGIPRPLLSQQGASAKDKKKSL